MNGERVLFAFRATAPCTNAPFGPVTCARRKRRIVRGLTWQKKHEKKKKPHFQDRMSRLADLDLFGGGVRA
jgi:hypothetical protein